MIVSLYVLNCERVNLVTALELPPFAAPPAVLIWGSRVFQLHDELALHYVEAWAYWAPCSPSQRKPAPTKDKTK